MMVHTLDTTVAFAAMTDSGLFYVVAVLAEFCLFIEKGVLELSMLRVINEVLDFLLVLFGGVLWVGFVKL